MAKKEKKEKKKKEKKPKKEKNKKEKKKKKKRDPDKECELPKWRFQTCCKCTSLRMGVYMVAFCSIFLACAHFILILLMVMKPVAYYIAKNDWQCILQLTEFMTFRIIMTAEPIAMIFMAIMLLYGVYWGSRAVMFSWCFLLLGLLAFRIILHIVCLGRMCQPLPGIIYFFALFLVDIPLIVIMLLVVYSYWRLLEEQNREIAIEPEWGEAEMGAPEEVVWDKPPSFIAKRDDRDAD